MRTQVNRGSSSSRSYQGPSNSPQVVVVYRPRASAPDPRGESVSRRTVPYRMASPPRPYGMPSSPRARLASSPRPLPQQVFPTPAQNASPPSQVRDGYSSAPV